MVRERDERERLRELAIGGGRRRSEEGRKKYEDGTENRQETKEEMGKNRVEREGEGAGKKNTSGRKNPRQPDKEEKEDGPVRRLQVERRRRKRQMDANRPTEDNKEWTTD